MLRSLLFRMEPERAHALTLQLLSLAGALPPLRSGLRRIFSLKHPALRVRAFGLDFANPIGLAAGYDKNGTAMHGLACLGFGHLELGTVTPDPQPGNPRPRLFRLEQDRALINRMGFPNQGLDRLVERLRRRPLNVPIGVNIGKGVQTPLENADQDYLLLLEKLYLLVDYIAVNVSSPNTLQLRDLQTRDHLEKLLSVLAEKRTELQAQTAKRLPILVKFSPDLTATGLQRAVETVKDAGMDGVILTNTTTKRPELRAPLQNHVGGLSGTPLLPQALESVRLIGGLPIIGVGGISTADQAKQMLSAGADLLQLYTGLVYRGPRMVREILGEMVRSKDPGSPSGDSLAY